jgi:hypothetical protein
VFPFLFAPQSGNPLWFCHHELALIAAQRPTDYFSEKSPIRKALEDFFENSPETKQAVTQAARRALVRRSLSNGEDEDKRNLVLDIPIGASDAGFVVRDNVTINQSLEGRSLAVGSLEGDLIVASEAIREGDATDYKERVDQRTLHLNPLFRQI